MPSLVPDDPQMQGVILLVAGAVSFFTSLAGVSGAFLLLPFQVSVLGILSPAASATNHLFNVIAIPAGVLHLIREGRMAWGLALLLVAGSLPGAVLGAWLRVAWLTDAADFRRFVGAVLAWVALRLLWDLLRTGQTETGGAGRIEPLPGGGTGFCFHGREYRANPVAMVLLALLVGVVGGIYGIGGGSLMAPLLVGVFRMPVHAIAGATLSATLVTSLASVLAFQGLAPLFPHLAVAPDWSLGLLLGLGGAAGIALGTRAQRHIPPRVLRWGLFLLLAGIATRYIF